MILPIVIGVSTQFAFCQLSETFTYQRRDNDASFSRLYVQV